MEINTAYLNASEQLSDRTLQENKYSTVAEKFSEAGLKKEQNSLEDFITKLSYIFHNLFTAKEHNWNDNNVNKVVTEIATQSQELLEQYNADPASLKTYDRSIPVAGFPHVHIKIKIEDNKLSVYLIEIKDAFYFPKTEKIFSINLKNPQERAAYTSIMRFLAIDVYVSRHEAEFEAFYTGFSGSNNPDNIDKAKHSKSLQTLFYFFSHPKMAARYITQNKDLILDHPDPNIINNHFDSAKIALEYKFNSEFLEKPVKFLKTTYVKHLLERIEDFPSIKEFVESVPWANGLEDEQKNLILQENESYLKNFTQLRDHVNDSVKDRFQEQADPTIEHHIPNIPVELKNTIISCVCSLGTDQRTKESIINSINSEITGQNPDRLDPEEKAFLESLGEITKPENESLMENLANAYNVILNEFNSTKENIKATLEQSRKSYNENILGILEHNQEYLEGALSEFNIIAVKEVIMKHNVTELKQKIQQLPLSAIVKKNLQETLTKVHAKEPLGPDEHPSLYLIYFSCINVSINLLTTMKPLLEYLAEKTNDSLDYKEMMQSNYLRLLREVAELAKPTPKINN